MDLPFPHIVLFPKLPCASLYNALSTVMVFHTVLLLAKKETHVIVKEVAVSHGNEIHWSCYGLHYPEADDSKEGAWMFKVTVIAPIRCQQPGGLEQGFPKDTMCFESVVNIWHFFFYSQDSLVQE